MTFKGYSGPMKRSSTYKYTQQKIIRMESNNIAAVVERAGGIVIGSMTDNHKVNQRFNAIFDKKSSCEALHPLDNQRPWFLLFDSVHLLKCIRNNWVSEKCQN